jgi:hypothetical protein
MFLFILSLFLTLITALFIMARLPIRHQPAYLVGCFLLAYAEIILIAEIASLFQQINPIFYLLMNMVLFLLAGGIWQRGKRPSLWGPWS